MSMILRGSSRRGQAGATLVELMVAMTILTAGIVSYFGVYRNINKMIQSAKSKTLAVNLAQEKIESLKNLSYYRLLVTTSTASDANFSPTIYFDTGYYPSETVVAGGISFDRRVYVRKVSEVSGNLNYRSWDDADTGLKEVLVYVIWKEGTAWKKVEVRNLRGDPNRLSVDATIYGEVEDSLGSDLADARVEVLDNSAWYDLTDSGGDYSFNVAAGSFTLRASKQGYFPAYAQRSVPSGSMVQQDFDLTQMASGTISGVAYLRDHLVISQVVGSTVHWASGFDQEYIELYNPTTWTWTIATGTGVPAVDVVYQRRNQPWIPLILQYSSKTISPNSYYLIANTDTIRAGGVTRAADAVYDPTLTDYPNVIRINTDPGNDAAGVAIGWISLMTGMDEVGWKTNGQNPDFYEGSPLEQTIGLEQEEQFIRKTSSGSLSSGVGRAYDTNVNSLDFYILNPLLYGPRNTSDIEAPVSGTPARGAIVFANDNLAPPVIADSSGVFRLMSVATGTWTLTVSSSVNYLDVATVTVTANATCSVGNIALTTSSTNGYISGRVTTVLGAGINNIKLSATGASPYYTDSAGYYRITAPTGTVEVVANPGNYNGTYVSASSIAVVNLGQIVSNLNFALAQGGDIRGYVSTNGTDPLPGVAISAQLNGVEQGSTVSGADGRFTLLDLSTGSYILWAYPEPGESVVPASVTVNVTAAQSVFSTTFTVTNAKGKITGSLYDGGSLIKTGVLIMATTSTIAGNPPDLNYTLRAGTVKYYQVSSSADGRYEILVPGGYTYNIYGWYTKWSGSVPNTTRKNVSTAVTAGGTSGGVNLSWP